MRNSSSRPLFVEKHLSLTQNNCYYVDIFIDIIDTESLRLYPFFRYHVAAR